MSGGLPPYSAHRCARTREVRIVFDPSHRERLLYRIPPSMLPKSTACSSCRLYVALLLMKCVVQKVEKQSKVGSPSMFVTGSRAPLMPATAVAPRHLRSGREGYYVVETNRHRSVPRVIFKYPGKWRLGRAFVVPDYCRRSFFRPKLSPRV